MKTHWFRHKSLDHFGVLFTSAEIVVVAIICVIKMFYIWVEGGCDLEIEKMKTHRIRHKSLDHFRCLFTSAENLAVAIICVIKMFYIWVKGGVT